MDEYQPSYEEYPSESDKRIEELEKENKKIMGDVEIWKQNRFNLFQRLELYEMTRKEVAREIFEEIESVLSFSVYPQIRADGTIKTIKSKDLTVRFEDYETIKKKYTEEK